MPITMNPVDGSSNIAAQGFDEDTGTLRVQFQSGKTYEYAGVTPDDYADFAGADSLGRALTQVIKPNYTGVLLPTDEDGDTQA
jgi:hypothetical protein